MSSHMSTKERLLSLIDDFEIIAKELIENSNAPKHQKISQNDHSQLVDLLISKDDEFKSVLKLAEEQAQIEQKMVALKAKVHLRDQQIKRLQRRLKDSEEILSRALFQARQKLASINVANKKPVSSEELIKYAYRISASNAISAPLTWQQGDLRRPYPTDIEMRLGFLGKSDLSNVNGHSSQNQSATTSDFPKPSIGDVPLASQNQFAWMQSGELHMTMGKSSNATSVPLDTRNHKDANQDEVEVMSTDSSSTSSSDSQ
ncbi:mediator of RNA polymerase II transcription subunit 4 [Contarinia nasturtii]|uniref:mediator of RNA polymerase II transcription subunit 4 n=1 Tax=Contarinia nasturtii TaxID=265458 RepID=UPI0012D47CEB|nr:mediator of RNA polymerase II transcription subunit 4 [Contarinia nasturtii]